jgi:ferritin-like metal-binding protein YciE
MSDDTLSVERGSMRELYVDALWNLHIGAHLMMAKVPAMADAVSDEELSTALRDIVGEASHAAKELLAMLSHFAGPARVHAAELEALVGDAARTLAAWPSGDPRDVAVSGVVRTALHSIMPGCELAIVLADVVGFPQYVGTLEALLHQTQTTDENLRRLGEERIRAAYRTVRRPYSAGPGDH